MGFVRFQDLNVYRLAEDLSDSAWAIARRWDSFARDTVGKQLVRAVDSIGANIAEGSGRYSRTDNRRFVRMARGSFHETQHWLRRAYTRKLLTPKQTASLQALVEELGPKLNAYLSSLSRPRATQAAPPNRAMGVDANRITQKARAPHRHQTPNTKHQTPNTKHQTPNTKH
jgi:four helix bundle protein